MTFAAQMRIGSLEVLLALGAFGIIVGRSRRTPARAAVDLDVQLAFDGEVATFTVGEGRPARIIGRSGDAQISLADPEVSRRHASLQAAGGILYLTDLHSRNGTYLNGRRLRDEGIEVKAGDHIDVGNTRIEVIAAAPSP